MADPKMTLDKIQRLLAQSVGHRRKWRESAKEDFAFVAGHQWSDEDTSAMDESLRPRATFNEIGPIVDAVAGHEVSNRQEVSYEPRQLGAAGVNEVLTAAAEWVRDECDAEQEESDAFYDCTVCGEGWTDMEIEYEQDLDGRIEKCRVSPLEMDVDPLAERKNYSNAKWVCRTKIYDKAEALELWPDGSFENPEHKRESDAPVDVIAAAFYRSDSGAQGRQSDEQDQVLVHDFQWYEMEPVYRVPMKQISPQQGFLLMHGFAMEQAQNPPDQAEPYAHPDTLKPDANGLLCFDSSTWNNVKDILSNIEPIEQKKRCYYRMYFSGSNELECKETPTADSFTYKAMTAKRDRKDGTWYGLVRAMKDPQMWANKFMSSSLEIYAYSAKGGIIHKAGTFADDRNKEENWANPAAHLIANDDANLATDVMPRPSNPIPPGIFQLMQYCNERLSATAGVNPEVMGLSQALDPSGVLEEGRRQSGLNMLAYLFDGLRKYRKEDGRLLLCMIKKFIPQGRLIRVVGDDGAQYVPLVYDPSTAEYSVIVDEAPNTVNVKQRTWSTVVDIAEKMPGVITPQMALSALDYSPLPQALTNKWKKQAQQAAQQGPPPIPPPVQAKMANDMASANLKNAQAQNVQGQGQMEQQTALIEQGTERLRAAAEMQNSQAEIDKANAERPAHLAKAVADIAGAHASVVGAQAQVHQAHAQVAQTQLDAAVAPHKAAAEISQAHHSTLQAQQKTAQAYAPKPDKGKK